MKRRNALAFFLGIVLCTSSAFSQEKFPVQSITPEWTLFKEVNGVKIYLKKEVYSAEGRLDMDYAIIKLENTSDKELNVSYSPVVYYNLGCNGCNSDEFYKTLVIPAHSSIEGNLADSKLPVVMLLSNPNLKNGWIPESIAIEKLTVK
ncbi:hypothetical protein D3C87_35880 [compost metagenome]